MNQIVRASVIILLIGITMFMQVFASRMKSTKPGLLMPLLLFCCTFLVLWKDLGQVKVSNQGLSGYLTAFSYFSLFNIPTIILLCIYNYCQRKNRSKG